MAGTSHLPAQSCKEGGDTSLNKGSTVHGSVWEEAVPRHPVFQTKHNTGAQAEESPSIEFLSARSGIPLVRDGFQGKQTSSD